MGERSNEVSGEWVEPAAGAVVDDPAAELEVQIAETREQMSETVQAIGEKLSPTNIVADAKETVREATIGKVEDVAHAASGMANDMMNDPIGTVQDASAGIMDTIRANPVPAALAAIGIAMLWRSRSQGGDGSRRRAYGGYGGASRGYGSAGYGAGYGYPGYGGGYGASAGAAGGYGGGYDGPTGSGQSGSGLGRVAQTGRSVAEQAGSTVGHVAGQAGETVGQVVGQAGDTVGQVVGQAGETVGQVASRAGDAVGQVQQQAGQTVEDFTRQASMATRQAQTQLQRVFEQSPLVVGAAAVGVGALVATILPNTEVEQRLYGEPRDRLVGQAEAVAQEALAKVDEQVQSVQSSGSGDGQTGGQTADQSWSDSGSSSSRYEG